MSFTVVSGYGARSFRSPVATLSLLPISGNSPGDFIVVEDTGMGYGWSGSAWIAQVGGGPAITTVTGDIAASGSGSVVATIQPLSVTNSKIANATIDLTSKVTGVLPVINGGAAPDPGYREYHVYGGFAGSTSTGTYTYPYKTIQAAINAAQAFGGVNCVIFLHDSITESIVINNYTQNLLIQGFGRSAIDSQTYTVNGSVTISGTSTRIRLSGINFAVSGGGSPDLIDSSAGRNYFYNVGFTGGGGVSFTGSWARWREFTDCTLVGTISISGTPVAGSSISCWRTRGGGNYVLNSSNVTLALYDNLSVGNVTQTAGSLVIDGGRNFVVGAKVTSTTNSASDIMILQNVSFLTSPTSFFLINKTGTCPYIISNVFRSQVSDVLTGTRLQAATSIG